MAVCSAASPVVCSHAAYAAATAPIATDDGPRHHRSATSAVTERNEAAAERRSAANPSQAFAAANVGPDPGPENIRPEFTSGGDTE